MSSPSRLLRDTLRKDNQYTDRPPSPSPSSSSHSRRSSMTANTMPKPAPVPPLTPHEQVLRARLERVLRAGRTVVRAESSSSSSTHQKTGHNRPPSLALSTSERAEDENAQWHRSSPPPPTSRRPSSSSASSSSRMRPKHSNTDPLPTTTAEPLTPTTPPRSRSRSQSHPHPHYSDLEHGHFALQQQSSHEPQHEHQHQQEPLTPPPTPPLPAHMPQHPGLFNARKASARCRQIEGYVSFAAVEGLGEPPGCSGLDDDDAPGGAAVNEAGGSLKGTLGLGIGRIWRVFGE